MGERATFFSAGTGAHGSEKSLITSRIVTVTSLSFNLLRHYQNTASCAPEKIVSVVESRAARPTFFNPVLLVLCKTVAWVSDKGPPYTFECTFLEMCCRFYKE